MPNDQGIPYGAAREFTIVKYRGPLNFVESTPAITAAAIELVKNNPDRVSLTITNTGANDMFISLSPQAASVGLKIVAAGQIVNFNVDDDGELPAQRWFAASPSTSTAYVLEGVQTAFVPTPATTVITTRPYKGDY